MIKTPFPGRKLAGFGGCVSQQCMAHHCSGPGIYFTIMICKIPMTDNWHYVKNAVFAGVAENPSILGKYLSFPNSSTRYPSDRLQDYLEQNPDFSIKRLDFRMRILEFQLGSQRLFGRINTIIAIKGRLEHPCRFSGSGLTSCK